jgi:hypothetical protein
LAINVPWDDAESLNDQSPVIVGLLLFAFLSAQRLVAA